ncbi:MAG: PD-(D/E)XK nuclease family transposase [Candidatus Riesia sp.]|nr:PD-(D/E)XK nuclease family transposase [Candidatus Riesia sp.]
MEKPLISFDFAIKYLLKNKGDYDIIEGFISALFASQGYPPIKINALLDCESNKEELDLKKSIADLVVEDAEGNKYIVEIERAYTPNFMHKACFNSSRLVVDGIYGNQDYTTIKKIFHISLLYFSTKGMEKPIYHGKTIVHEVDTKHPVDVRIANEGLVVFDTPNVFPEYFFISVPMFNDVINSEIDEWLYVMKHAEIKEGFKSPYMDKVAERLSVIKMNSEERNEYIYYQKQSVHSQDILSSAEAKGKIEEKIKIARAMLAKNKPIEEIEEFTGLSIEEIEELRGKE